MSFYAGIGSRETPDDVLNTMMNVATLLASQGWKLRSGGAAGADRAFEVGHDHSPVIQHKEIFLPWAGYNNNPSQLVTPTQAAIDMSMAIHPNPAACKQGARKLHGRNAHIIFGIDLLVPVRFVMC